MSSDEELSEPATLRENQSQVNVFDSFNQGTKFLSDSITFTNATLDGIPYTETVVQKGGTNAILRQARKDPFFNFFSMDNSWGEALGMCLVENGDENQCVFDHAHALSVGKTVPLTLKSHPGIAICRQRYHWVHQDAKQVRGFAFKRMDTCGGTSDVIYVSFKKDNYIVMHQKNVTTGLLEASPFVMNTSRSVQVGNPVNFLDTNVSAFDAENGDFGCAGGGDDWFINSNGTISQKYTPELVLGFKTAGHNPILPAKYRGIKFFKKDFSFFNRIGYMIEKLQEMLTMRWFTRNIEKNLKDNPQEVYDRLMAEWGNLGVVSTLMIGIAFESFGSTLDEGFPETELWGYEADVLIELLNFISILFDFIAIVSLLLLGMALNTLPSKLTGEFVSQFSLVLSLPEVCTVLGLLVYMFTATMRGLVMLGPSFTVGVILLFGSVSASFLFLFIIPFLLDREGGLWEKARKLNDEAALQTLEEEQGILLTEFNTVKNACEETFCEGCL